MIERITTAGGRKLLELGKDDGTDRIIDARTGEIIPPPDYEYESIERMMRGNRGVILS